MPAEITAQIPHSHRSCENGAMTRLADPAQPPRFWI
jgi:hypothetical protein